jgi:transcriptional regulator with XRE-family HTH domain
MSQSGNGQLPHQGTSKGNFTGQRLARDRPKVYRQVIALLAQGTSDAKIARLCGVSRNTVAAVRQVEVRTIEQRKQTILATAARVAELGFERIEEELAAGNIKGAQLVPVAGMATDKVVLLSNDPQQIQLACTLEPGPNLYEKLTALANAINARSAAPRTIGARAEPPAAPRQLPNGETISDSGR